jgi:hypothetical protein
MTFSQVHGALANACLYYFIALAVWGTWRFIRKQGVASNYWGALVIAEILLALQFLLGGYLWLAGFRPARSIHVLYGIVSLLALPGVYMYTKGRTERPEMLMYAVVALITVGLILRAMFTGEVAL